MRERRHMKAKPLVRRPLEAWHKIRTSKDQAHFARSDTFKTTRDQRAAATPWTWRTRRGTDSYKKRLMETLAAAPNHEHEAVKKWKGNSKWQMKPNILGSCIAVTGSLIWATRERVTVAGTSSFLTHQALEHGEVFPTGRLTGSELPTVANGDLICCEQSKELILAGIIMKGCSMQKKAHPSETVSSTCFLTKLKLEKCKLSTHLYYRSCCNAVLGNGCRTATVLPCIILLRRLSS